MSSQALWTKRARPALVAGAAAALLAPALLAQPEIPTRAPAGAPAQAVLADDGEPGEPLVVSGRVTDARGEPVAAASFFVYQTGADGIYGPRGNSDPRLHAYLRTDAEGGFELRTVRPGSYPGTRVPAHIHYHAAPAKGGRETIGELVFDDDPLLGERARRSPFYTVCKPHREAGVLRCTLDVRLLGG